MSLSRTLPRGRLLAALLIGALVGLLMALHTSPAAVRAGPAAQFSDPVKQGEYLTIVAGCRECHTPPRSEADPQPDASRFFAGGRAFPLGPLGVVVARNLTSDQETGLGSWSDEEIKTAIRSGQARDGHMLFPLMPYPLFNNMADSDVDAIVAYLRTVPAIKNEVPRRPILPEGALQPIPARAGIQAPSPSDTAARGRYLMTSVLPCTDCHTPLNPESGQPVMEQFLAGGQPFEGPWGIIYGGNITPHETTGIGTWSDQEIKRVLQKGVRPDNRQVILMPWADYTHLTEEDINAVVHFLRNDVKPVDREVPAPSLKPEFIRHVAPEPSGVSPLLIGAAIGAVVVVGAGAFALRRRGRPAAR